MNGTLPKPGSQVMAIVAVLVLLACLAPDVRAERNRRVSRSESSQTPEWHPRRKASQPEDVEPEGDDETLDEPRLLEADDESTSSPGRTRHAAHDARRTQFEVAFDDDETVIHEGQATGETESLSSDDGEPIVEGEMIEEPGIEYSEDEFGDCEECESCGCSDCDGGCYTWDGPSCGDPFAPGCMGHPFLLRHTIRSILREAAVFAGPQAFKGPLDQGRNGNFGFHEGVNFAGMLPRHPEFGYQIGANFVESNLLGDHVTGVQSHSRNQTFITAGIFHRAYHGHGWQFGAAYDWLQDLYYVRPNLGQVRGELSYLTPCGHEFGFWGSFHTRGDTVTINRVRTELQPTDQYNFFYRRNLPNGAHGRIWGGFSGRQDGLIGADFRVPLSNRFDFTGIFNYLIPQQGTARNGFAQESWGLSMNLVWYPGRGPAGTHNGPYRALMRVADNATFMVDHLGN